MNEAKQTIKPVAAAIALVKFNRAKTVNAVAMTEKQTALHDAGEELGYTSAENDIAWRNALKLVKSPADRIVLRSGFVSAFTQAQGVSEKSAANRFDYLARQHAPAATSRQAKANAKKSKAGRKEKTSTGTGEHVPAQDVALRLAAVLHYVAKAQAMHIGDAEMLELLGEIAAIAGGAKAK